MTKPILLGVFSVKGFDPNRPDLQDFLNKLAAEAFGEESAPRRPRRRRAARAREGKPRRSARR